jgi:ferric-dicitrate binding protein FerR (iron transport regulator)
VRDTSHQKAGPTLARLREELHADADLGPARLELERRRLVATVASGPRAARFRKAVALGAVAGLAAAAAALLVFIATAPPAKPDAPIRITGLVDVGAADPLTDGRTARVPPSSGAKLALADGTALWLGAESAVSSPDGGAHRIRLEAGRALAQVARQKGPARFVFETMYGDIEVHGTVFSARITAAGLTVDLYEGAVRFSRGDTSIDLKPGESLLVRRDGAIAARGPIDRAAVLADLMITEKTADLPGAPVPRLAPPAEIAPGAASVESTARPISPAAPAPVPPPEAKRPTRRPPAEAKAKEPAAPVEATAEPAPFAHPAPAEIAVEAAPPADEKLFLDAYEKAVSGEPEDARALLEKYLASFPDGRYWQRVAEILGEE